MNRKQFVLLVMITIVTSFFGSIVVNIIFNGDKAFAKKLDQFNKKYESIEKALIGELKVMSIEMQDTEGNLIGGLEPEGDGGSFGVINPSNHSRIVLFAASEGVLLKMVGDGGMIHFGIAKNEGPYLRMKDKTGKIIFEKP